jgi:hypothetical protein
MLSEHEIQFHRSFLSLKLALAIWNDYYKYQNSPGGRPPDREKKIESDPVYAYHDFQGPHWPSKPPGDPAARDKKYGALLARADGSLEPLVVTTKRGMSGQNFASAATPWEVTNSVLCGAGEFSPIVNPMMEVTGHYRNVNQQQLIHPKGIDFSEPSEYLTNEVPLYYLPEAHVTKNTAWAGSNGRVTFHPAPEGWEAFTQYNGGIDILVLPNGEVIGAHGHLYSSNNGHAVSVMSPLDFWAPGSRLLASGIRALTNRISAAAVKGFKVLTAPSKQLAALSVARLAGKTLPGVAAQTVPVAFKGSRALVLGDDMAAITTSANQVPGQSGLFDVIVHGDKTSFWILRNKAWEKVSVRDLANAIRPKLGPNDKIRLIGCETGVQGGPAQQLADELGRNVFAPTTAVYPELGTFFKASHRQFNQIQAGTVYESVKGYLYGVVPDKFGKYVTSRGGELVKHVPGKSLVPVDGGTFKELIAQRGAGQLAGQGGKVVGNEVSGVINPGAKKVNQHVIKRK